MPNKTESNQEKAPEFHPLIEELAGSVKFPDGRTDDELLLKTRLKKHSMNWIHFASRPLMYIPSLEKGNVISFVTGFEVGSGDISFTQSITTFLKDEAQISHSGYGWSGQVELYARSQNTDWITAFFELVKAL